MAYNKFKKSVITVVFLTSSLVFGVFLPPVTAAPSISAASCTASATNGSVKSKTMGLNEYKATVLLNYDEIEYLNRLKQNATNIIKSYSLTIKYPVRADERGVTEYSQKRFCYPQLSFTSNADLLMARYGKGTLSYKCAISGMDAYIEGLCRELEQPRAAWASFNARDASFAYCEGRVSVKIDRERLYADVTASLDRLSQALTAQKQGVNEGCEAAFSCTPPKRTALQLKNNTVRASSFTTYFDGNNEARASNVRLAASAFNGYVLASGETLSFNAVVGRRGAERGYKGAKIISDGKYVEGVGGGVCQTSTTLYNCALLCGLKITERHPHSLLVGYVEPSFDAMVSSACDLKIKNATDCDYYVRALCKKNSVTFELYGKQAVRLSRESEIVSTERQTEDGEEYAVITSRAFLLNEKTGKRVCLGLNRYKSPLKIEDASGTDENASGTKKSENPSNENNI